MVTIDDVARAAKVSKSTVSRVLHNKPYVTDELRARVWAAVEELDYSPSRVARRLRSQTSSIIGVIITDVQNAFFTDLARAVEDVAYEHNYAVILCNSDEDLDKERLYLELMRAEHVAGIIISPASEENSPIASLAAAGFPIITVDRRIPNLDLNTVIVDNRGGALTLTNHLLQEHGLQRIALITGPEETTTGRERLEGFVQAHEEAGLPLEQQLLKVGSFKEEFGYQSTRELLALDPPPEAIFAGNALLAQGAMRALTEGGWHVPEEIALVAFDRIQLPAFCEPSITCMAQSSYELGRISARLLFQNINDSDAQPTEVVLAPQLVINESCGCEPEGRGRGQGDE